VNERCNFPLFAVSHVLLIVESEVVKRSGRKEVAISAGGAGGANALLLRGARTIRTLSARYIADLQDDWEEHGKEALKEYRERFPERLR
jgi:hypothetical protein